ncbi:mesogenin-1 [Amia ocellicauda]|uniref:mesogenin-1 n=1 Tax=Amia ocellicauda TaxID=2972642 RepID=UPI00346483B3
MDSALSQFLLQADQPLFDCDALLEQTCTRSDCGYYSASGSLSPASSIDSCCFSPPPLQCGARPDCAFLLSSPAVPEQRPLVPAPEKKRKSRSKYPGIKRQSASDREKLRMRDLTKALHHLRTYLPPSVAPAGQTLTKIDTLRLTMRYISHLSAQLGLSEEVLSQRSQSDPPQSLCHPQENMQTHFQETSLFQPDLLNTNATSQVMSGQLSNTMQSNQSYSEHYSLSESLPADYWLHQQQDMLSGLC